MILDDHSLINKHRDRGFLVDANLLVLLVIGLVNRHRIVSFKRTSSFTVEDFDLLSRLIDWFGKPIFSTPHILSQVSDLIDLGGRELALARRKLKEMIELIDERVDPARTISADSAYQRLGLADAAICHCGARGLLVLTADLDLWVALVNRGFDTINFNHIRNL